MAGSKILVLGATGPTGINVLRELIHRKLSAVVYARTPSKIPPELQSSPYIEIIQGEFRASDEPALSRAIAQCYAVISLIGPVLGEVRSYTPTFFADIYTQQVLPLMIQHSVPRILAMSTVSVYRQEDSFSFLRWLNSLVIRLLFSTAQKNMFAVEAAFDNDKQAHELDWTVYRMVIVLGGCDEQSWQKDRAAGEMYAGPVGAKGFSLLSRRGQLARWLVDAALDKNGQWSQKMPAVSRVAGGKSSKAA